MGIQPLLGFVLLTHEKPEQILRLIERLNFMFDDPPIACHHDFSQCELLLDRIPGNVSFVMPSLKTKWGGWSLIEATVKGFDLLYSRDDKPKWFTLLSGTDYPIKPAESILEDFRNSRFDVHISSKKLVKEELRNSKEQAMYQRYHAIRFEYPSLFHIVQSFRKKRWVIEDIMVKNPRYIRHLVPFSDHLICFMGSQWFSANQKAVNYLLDYHSRSSKLKKYYKRVNFADESYFHTVFNNAEELKVNSTFWRYMDWEGQIAHPRTLSMEDLPNLLDSEDHFARKFNLQETPELLGRLDEEIGFVIDLAAVK